MKPEDAKAPSGIDSLRSGLAKGASNVAGLLWGKYRTCCMGMSVTRKGEYEWLAVMRAYDVEAHEHVVAFGNGADAISALMALNASIGKAKWSQDKFVKAGQPDWKVDDLRQLSLPLGGAGRM